jgi:hypothetical protein
MEIIIAPPDVLIRFLAAFSRFFRESQKFLETKDHGGIVLTGYAANALHNVPGHLRRYKEDWKDNWFPFDETYARRLRAKGASERLIAVWDEIFTPMQDSAELCRNAELSNWDIAPPAVFDTFMGLFRDACLAMRFLRNLSSEPVEWQTPDASVIREGERAIIASTQIARAFAPLPTALLHWSSFDPEGFLNNDEMIESTVLHDWWERSMEQVREAVSAASSEGRKQ